MFDPIFTEVSAGTIIVLAAAGWIAVRLLGRHVRLLTALALGLGIAYAMGVRGADLVVDALALSARLLVEALSFAAEVVDPLLLAAFEVLEAGAARLVDWSTSDLPAPGPPEIGIPDPSALIGFGGSLAAVFVVHVLVGVALIWVTYESSTGSPAAAWTGGVGVVLFAAGTLLTLLQTGAVGSTVLQSRLAVVAATVGLAVGVLTTVLLARPNYRDAFDRASEEPTYSVDDDGSEEERDDGYVAYESPDS